MTPAIRRHAARVRSARGQSIVEFAVVLPFLLLIVLGVVETSYALLDQHVVTKLAREGSNLISRDTSLQQAARVMQSMGTAPVNLAPGGTSAVIFSVLKKGATTGTTNFGQVVLFQRYQFGSLAASSRLTSGSTGMGGPPDYLAVGPDTNANLQITNLPDSIINVNGGFLYVTEVFTQHQLVTPLDRLLPYGVTIPTMLYSIAYF